MNVDTYLHIGQIINTIDKSGGRSFAFTRLLITWEKEFTYSISSPVLKSTDQGPPPAFVAPPCLLPRGPRDGGVGGGKGRRTASDLMQEPSLWRSPSHPVTAVPLPDQPIAVALPRATGSWFGYFPPDLFHHGNQADACELDLTGFRSALATPNGWWGSATK
jgi:hypothetical protein